MDCLLFIGKQQKDNCPPYSAGTLLYSKLDVTRLTLPLSQEPSAGIAAQIIHAAAPVGGKVYESRLSVVSAIAEVALFMAIPGCHTAYTAPVGVRGVTDNLARIRVVEGVHGNGSEMCHNCELLM